MINSNVIKGNNQVLYSDPSSVWSREPLTPGYAHVESDFTSDQVQQCKKTELPTTGATQRKEKRLSCWDAEERLPKRAKKKLAKATLTN